MTDDDFHKRKTLPGVPEDDKGSAAPIEIPQMIGPYKIESLLEKGGMSLIYLGIHPETKEPTTIKVLSPKYLSHPEVVQRFLNEAEIIAMTDHPNIVKLYGHGDWEGGLYIAMEYVRGMSLRHELLQKPISLKRGLEIVIDIAYALCHLHTHGVIHRDLKPENILITEAGEVKVIDFGIAQLLTEKNISVASTSQRLIGTPIYMSPEQRENPEKVSYPSDIYSLGIITYEVVLGKLSHGHIHLSLMPKGLQTILKKALQPEPQGRYHDVVDFITDLSAYLNSTNLEKEKKPGDHLSEMSEDMRHVRDLLIPATPPAWPNIEIAHGSVKGMEIYGTFYDYFSLPNGTYAIVMGESSSRGAEGVVFASFLRGMIQSIVRQRIQPEQIVSEINQTIIDDRRDEIFTLSFLLLNPHTQSLEYISCGQNYLWSIPAQKKRPLKIGKPNIALGIDPAATFQKATAPWMPGDRLVLAAFTEDSSEEKIDSFLERECSEYSETTEMRKIVDAILRKAKLAFPKSLQNKSLSIITLQRIPPS